MNQALQVINVFEDEGESPIALPRYRIASMEAFSGSNEGAGTSGLGRGLSKSKGGGVGAYVLTCDARLFFAFSIAACRPC